MVSAKTTHTKQEMAQGAAKVPEGSRPWEDRTLPATERYQSYYDVARAKCEAIRDAGNREQLWQALRSGVIDAVASAITTSTGQAMNQARTAWSQNTTKRLCHQNPAPRASRIAR